MPKEKHLIPKLRFPEFNKSWNKTHFSNIIEFVKSGKSSKEENGIYDLYGSTGIIGRTNDAIDNGQYLLVARVGANAGQINYQEGEFGVSDNTLIISFKEYINIHFIKGFLVQFNLNKLVFGSGQPLVTAGLLKKIKLNLPDINEQQKIAQFLTAIDTCIQNLEKKKTLLEQYKKGVMQKIFKKELRFKIKNEAGELVEPPEWNRKKLEQICNIVKGKQLNKAELTDIGTYPCQNGGILPSGYTEKYNTDKNTITISEGGNSCGYVNFLETRFWCGGHCYSLLNLEKEIHNKFLFQFLKFKEKGIMRLRVGSGLPNIQRKDILSFKIELPCLEEQTKIANFLSAIDKKIDLTHQQIEHTKTYKKGLLQQMFV